MIKENYFTQVRGGTNTDISNTELGVYYKFNEGITGDDSIDSTVLDYSGRISNGIWFGYQSDARATGSAILCGGWCQADRGVQRDPHLFLWRLCAHVF